MLTDRSSHSRQFTTPIPTFLSDRDVTTGHHDHNNVLTLQALITGHKEVDLENYPTVLTDPSFPAGQYRILDSERVCTR